MTLKNQVGDDIRALRRSRGVTIKDLAASVGRSIGWLSQVERGQTLPSIDDLSAIATHFAVNISFFFRSADRDPAEMGLVLRHADRASLGSSGTGLTEALISPTLGGSFEIIESVFAPHSASGQKPTRQVEHGGVLLSGRLHLTVDGQQFQLHPGDSFQFAGKPYSWANPHDAPAVVIWVVSPPVY